VARELYPAAFSARPIDEPTRLSVQRRLTRNLAAFTRLARFEPYLGGAAFTLADLVAYIHLPIISMATKAVYGSDLVVEAGIDWKAHAQRVGARPAAQQIVADRKAYLQQQKTPA
jgi:glutathione S-transferase